MLRNLKSLMHLVWMRERMMYDPILPVKYKLPCPTGNSISIISGKSDNSLNLNHTHGDYIAKNVQFTIDPASMEKGSCNTSLFERNFPMKRTVLSTCLCAILGLIAGSEAAVLFSDDFQDAATSKAKWIFPDSVTATYGNGSVTLRNKDSQYMWFVSHTMTSKISTFTLTAKITLSPSASSGVGIAYCKTDSTGIILQMGNVQNLYVKKFTPSQQPVVFDVMNSFISMTTNVIVVSKKESVFNVFCNNNFLGSFTVNDPLFSAGGDIGLVLLPKTSAVFEDIAMTDDFRTGFKRTCFSDDFSDADHVGWYTYTISGTYQSGGGKFAVANNDAQMSGLLFVNGDFRQSSLKVITSFKSGKNAYGCMFVYTVPTSAGNTYRTFSFLVDSTQRYGVSNPDSQAIKMNVPKSYVHGATGGGRDTLEVRRYNDKIAFLINNTVAESSLPVPTLLPDGAGVYVGPQTSVSFEMFSVGGDSTGAFCPVLAAPQSPAKRFAPIIRLSESCPAAFDALGRINGRFGRGYLEASRTGASGVIFLRPSSGAATPAAVRILK
jgi:hypothetical protein